LSRFDSNSLSTASDDEYDKYESQFDPLATDRQARRKRKPKPHHTPKKSTHDVLETIAETTGLEGGFETTYQPSLFEQGWLLDAIRAFYEQDLISDVLFRVRGGKEANVYCCKARPALGVPMLAAKVYRPQMFRNLRNDKLYREGRMVLGVDGKGIRANEQRVMRAIAKKTGYGEQVSHTSWLMYEFQTLQRLYNAGAAVPKPIATSENAILMRYHGDERIGAPTLNGVTLDYEELEPLFSEVMRNVGLLVGQGYVHGDLSAYNILYWRGNITLIDFPQVVDIRANRSARLILERDVRRVCEYFAKQGLERDANHITHELWDRSSYLAPVDLPDEGDLSELDLPEEDDE